MLKKILFWTGAVIVILATVLGCSGVFLYPTEASHVLGFFSPLVYPLAFVLILSIVVIIHEGGHFLAARLCGIKVTAFSVGFGKKLWSRVDKKGTEWKLCAVPLGGYVQMFGDDDAASMTENTKNMTEEEKKLTFSAQALWKRAIVIFAGPFMNFFFAVMALTILFWTEGYFRIPPIVGEVLPGTLAEEIGLQSGDKILFLNNHPIADFTDIKHVVSLSDYEKELSIKILRGDRELVFRGTPKFDEENGRPLIGIRSDPKVELIHIEYDNPVEAFGAAVKMTYQITADTVVYLGQVIRGQRQADEMRGPIGIAEASGDAAKNGIFSLLMFLIQVSIGIGFINLLPMPPLDGGHLALYAVEAVVRRPLGEKAQNFLLKVGVFLLFCLFTFTLCKDIPRIVKRVFDL